jgi:alpha-D-xyloside xylohydrolase
VEIPNSNVTGFSREGIKKVVDSFVLEPDDRLYGFGEKFFAHNKRGHTMTSWNLDAYGVETERAYKNIPFFLCSKGYGVLVNSTARMEHAVGDPAHSRASYILTIESEYLDYFVFWGPSFKHILNRYADLTGHAPVPPQWAFGLWMSRCYFHNRAVAEEVAHKLRELKIPADVMVFDGYWVRDGHQCDLLWDEERFNNPKEMLEGLKAQGFKSCVWEAPFVPSGTEMFEEAQAQGFLLQNRQGEDYLISTGLVGNIIRRFQARDVGSFDGLPHPPVRLPIPLILQPCSVAENTRI